MKTIRMTQEEMRKRISRFRELRALPIQNGGIPEEARDASRHR